MKIKIKIEGTAPLIFTKVSLSPVYGTKIERCEKMIPRDESGDPAIKTVHVLYCITKACVFRKHSKRRDEIYSSLDISETYSKILHASPWEIYSGTFRGIGHVSHFHLPMFNDWALEFTLNVDENVISESELFRSITHAGSRIGLGWFRPTNGSFVVASWQPELEGETHASIS